MNVCFVNTTDLIGGAERCSFDLLRGFRSRGHQASLVVGSKLSDDPDVYPCRYPAWDWKPRAFLHHRLGLTDTTLVAPFRMMRRQPASGAQIINIHNMHGCYWNFWTVPLLARRVPVVLTLHDEWLYTGDCVYAHDCERWRRSCGRCPQLSWTVRPDLGGRDLTRINLLLKRAALRLSRSVRLRIVTPSEWLSARVRKTPLGRFPVHTIANGIDVSLYYPRHKSQAKASFGLPPDKFCFLFMALNVDDPRKGFGLLEATLRRFGLPPDSVLLLAGKGSEGLAQRLKDQPVRCAGYLCGAAEVRQCFSAADCMLLLSEADNLPYSAVEASACGCPLLARDVGGVGEVVEHPSTGRLLAPNPTADELASAMKEFVSLPAAEWRRLSAQARRRAVEHFGMDRFLRRYEALFDELIETQPKRPAAGRRTRMLEKAESLEAGIVDYALNPDNQARFARLLNRILPAYVQWTWGREGTYRAHFNEWQRHGFNLSPNHYYSPIPDVGRLSARHFGETFELTGIDLREAEQLLLLEKLQDFRNEYALFPAGKVSDPCQFHFNNGVFESGDAEVLYAMVRHFNPRRVIEVGAGHTSLLTAAACEINRKERRNACEFIAIEPYPNDLFRNPIPGLTRLIRRPLQEIELELFLALEDSDILFIDSSHVLKIGSDVHRLFLEILPRLRPGVLVHFHDIFLPGEYPKEWILEEHIFWNEQYLLQAFLAFNACFEVLWAGAFMHRRHPEKLRQAFPAYDPSQCLPGGFWIRRHR
jgi:glycosyltransferase involved in cell wall biosynthesis